MEVLVSIKEERADSSYSGNLEIDGQNDSDDSEVGRHVG